MKHLKKLISILAVLSLMAGIFCGLTVSGAVADWYASVGAPTMNAAADPDFCSFRVNAAAAMTSKKTANVLEREVFIQNLSVADGGYWGMIGFKAQATKLNDCVSDPTLGNLALLLENKKTYYKLYFFRDNKTYEIGKLPIDDTYCIRFQKADDGIYQMQINGNTYRHDFIDTYGKKGFFRKSYVTVFASNWMSGEITIRNRFWDSENAGATTAVYPCDDTTVIRTESKEDYFYTNDVVDFSTDKVELSEVTVPENAKFSLCFNQIEPFYEKSTASNGSVLNFSFADNGETIDVTLAGKTPTLLGTVPKADSYSCRFIQKDDSYTLKVNNTVLAVHSAIKAFMKSPEAFLILGTNSAFSSKVYLCRYSWYQFLGAAGAKVQVNDDDSCYISVTASQNVVAPRQYDLFTTGIELSGLEIPAPNTSSHGALIYLGKTLSKAAPCVAAQDALSLLIEKTADGVNFCILNSNGGTKTLLGTMAAADSYRIRFIRKYKRWVLLVNDTVMDINTKTDAQSTRAVNDIKTYLGDGNVCKTYIAFAANNYAKATVRLFSFVPPEDPEGFSVLNGTTVGTASGNETNGYTVKESAPVTVLSNNIYNQVDYSLAVTMKSDPARLIFWVSKTDISDRDFTPGKNPNRFAFFLTPAEDNTKAAVSCIGTDGTTEIPLGTVNYNWSGKRILDVRKATDGNWYLAVNSMPVQGVVLPELNDFMNSNVGGELFYGVGSTSAMELSLLKIVASPVTPVPIDDPGWQYYADNSGDLKLDADGTYSLSKPEIQTFAFSKGTYDITKTSLSIKINSVKEWLYFSISTTGVSDNNPLPSGLENPNRVAFVIAPQSNFTKAQVSIWARNREANLTVLDVIDFDWSAVHTFDVRAGSDGHWYLWVDNKMKSQAVSPMLDDFIDRNGTTALRYGTGGFAGFDAEQIHVVDQTPGDNYIDNGGWRIYSGAHVLVDGDSRDGYNMNVQSGMFAYSKLTYDITKTALSLQVNDIGGWLYFSISATNESDNYLPVGSGDQISRVVFVITPSGMNAQFGHWAPDGKSATLSIITAYEFDWFGSSHTFDVRRSNDPEDENWYLCVDGRLLMNRVSEVLNQFMKKHDGEELYYGTGGFTGFGASEIKIVNKPALKTAEESSEAGGGTVEYTGDYDFDIDFDNLEDQENTPAFDYDFGGDLIDDDNSVDFEDDPELTEMEDPREYLQVVKAKKRRLVQKGHGLIFDPWEIVLMIVGGVLLLGGSTFTVIFFIKRSRKKKQE